MLPARLAHQLSREAWDRRRQQDLERALVKVEGAVLQAARTGSFNTVLPARSIQCAANLASALEALGYKCEARRRGKTFVVSWGAAGGRDG